MRKADFLQQRDVRAVRSAFSAAHGQGRPFARAIRGEDGRLAHRRGEEGGSGMRPVMLGEQDFLARHAQLGRDDAADPQFFAQGVLHGMGEGTPGMGKGAQGAGQYPIEFQHRALVEDDRVEIVGFQAPFFQAPFDRGHGKGRVVLAPREPLLLDRGHRHAVHDQGRGGVVIMRGDSENFHVSTGFPVCACLPAARAPSPAVRGAGRAWPKRQKREAE